ncbi:hypothetical protein, partial [Ralstonia pseudosolanacearum]|uniref:hypothetical protein n=1 Tax=Ralstonia pseudosolanacearum TaxID=1310165 RepID=UPI001E5D188C
MQRLASKTGQTIVAHQRTDQRPRCLARWHDRTRVLETAHELTKETLINGVREWNREPSCSRFPHRGKEVPIEHVFRRFRVV